MKLPRTTGLLESAAPGLASEADQTMIETRKGVVMDRSQSWLRWVWPALPALLVAIALANSDWIDRRCPDYTTPLAPHPEQCLPTLLPDITGANPLLVGLTWLAVAACVYAVVALAAWVWRRRAGA